MAAVVPPPPTHTQKKDMVGVVNSFVNDLYLLDYALKIFAVPVVKDR